MIFHQPFNSHSNYSFNVAFYTTEVWNFHFHRNMELIYVLYGRVKCTVNNEEYIVGEGDFGLCLPYDIHRYEPGENTKYFVLVFSEDFVRLFFKQITGKMGDGFVFRCNSHLEGYVRARLIENPSLTNFTLKSCLYGLCEEYLEQVSLVDRKRKMEDNVVLIADYVLQNHTKKLSLLDVAKKFGYDYNYTSRLFKKSFNMTFSEFLNAHRLETALRLLDETDKNVTFVAYESGFQSVRSFNDFFRSRMGICPSDYRGFKCRPKKSGNKKIFGEKI